ncbi:DUF4192 domain-containing protein [Streptomyces sp. RFCAC02]|uniref:DUF4192 domain-containing protein n=1 Tax=Streptomyces sp. RFCAC02 TaxID=2499143 RepID=UPI00143D8636|nr:DUF4192 domain-containing protein [Streptomyces sp. RFCAC02]
MTRHSASFPFLPPSADRGPILRGPAELAAALPHLLGYRPDDSIVLIGLHGPRGSLGGRIRTGIPRDPARWNETADHLAACLARTGGKPGGGPDAAIVCLCQEPPPGAPAAAAAERLTPLAQRLRTACGALDIPVVEALYVAHDRFWSYCSPGTDGFAEEGSPLPRGWASPLAAAASGTRPPGSLAEIERRLTPGAGILVAPQVRAFDEVIGALLPRMIGDAVGVAAVRAETQELAERLVRRLRRAGGCEERGPSAADARDDALITSAEAARLVVGLDDRTARDRAAEWMEGTDAPHALRLWSALARRCVAEYAGYAAAPLTLAGWVLWSTGDPAGARIALGHALCADPEYTFARLLEQACREGIDPEPLRQTMRRERADRTRRAGGSGAL